MRGTVAVRVSLGGSFELRVRRRWGPAPDAVPLVLLSDPDPDAREIGRTALEAFGYRMATAADGEECVRLARLLGPDLVITEIFSPRLDGFAVARSLRRDPCTAAIPVAALTTCDLPSYRERARREGFARYWPKPVEPARLVVRVECLLGRPAPGRAGSA